MFDADNGAMIGYLESDEPELMDTDRVIDGTINFAKLAQAVITACREHWRCTSCDGCAQCEWTSR